MNRNSHRRSNSRQISEYLHSSTTITRMQKTGVIEITSGSQMAQVKLMKTNRNKKVKKIKTDDQKENASEAINKNQSIQLKNMVPKKPKKTQKVTKTKEFPAKHSKKIMNIQNILMDGINFRAEHSNVSKASRKSLSTKNAPTKDEKASISHKQGDVIEGDQIDDSKMFQEDLQCKLDSLDTMKKMASMTTDNIDYKLQKKKLSKSVSFASDIKKSEMKRSNSIKPLKSQRSNSTLSNENERMKTWLMIANQKISGLDAIEESANQLKEKVKQADDEIFKLQDDCTNLRSEIENQNKKNEDANNNISELQEQIKANLAVIDIKDKELKDGTIENRSLSNRIQSLEQMVQSLNDKIESLSSNVATRDATIETAMNDKSQLVDKVFEQSNQIQDQLAEMQKQSEENKSLCGQLQQLDLDSKSTINKLEQEAKTEIDKLNQDVKCRNEMIQNHQDQIAKLIDQNSQLENKLPIYIPRKYDKIDQALSKFINAYPERQKMKILFMRHSEGVYAFGQKKIYVKVEKGNQCFVRVGGGFMHVKEFIEKFTELETEKISRKNVTTGFSKLLKTQRLATDRSHQSAEIYPITKGILRSRSNTIIGDYKSNLKPLDIKLQGTIETQDSDELPAEIHTTRASTKTKQKKTKKNTTRSVSKSVSEFNWLYNNKKTTVEQN